ncbi:flavin containing amine oxidoreductase [Legionella donaldsonii]|uniref:Flavin containing amine oxidoreductase n=1 Tax=Legionella donaldsonii TaxID=45060 RepID=A0A378J1P4_9GAMM|nr:FAD-dependent oxidoreductase [Legionella donaldsonii]STX41459.1 flavin containing amine oxidoreductase [Legionella donaldsonii]
MKIAIIGSGISGLTCAYYLKKEGYDPYIFEANTYVGGHTHTVELQTESGLCPIDTGFIVFNEKTYPNFVGLLRELDVASQMTDMSFSVFDPQSRFQYAGGSLNSLFAARKNLLSYKFYRLISEIYRFQLAAKKLLARNEKNLILSEFIGQHGFHTDLANLYLYPLISALWSTPLNLVEQMPAYFVANFFYNHALLEMMPSLPWKVIQGGSHSYVKALTRRFENNIYLNTAIEWVKPKPGGGYYLSSKNEEIGHFEKVIIATHSDQALAMLACPDELTVEILSQFTYQPNEVILHTDTSVLPSNHRAWASWNYLLVDQNVRHAVLNYYMNRLQNLSTKQHYCVSLNARDFINPEKIIQIYHYAHPQYTIPSLAAQSRQKELNRNGSLYFCGAYWGFGFHEDGVKSALTVCKQILSEENHEPINAA